jgi:hypothetical protein
MFGRKMTKAALASLNAALEELQASNANNHAALAIVDRLIAENELLRNEKAHAVQHLEIAERQRDELVRQLSSLDTSFLKACAIKTDEAL